MPPLLKPLPGLQATSTTPRSPAQGGIATITLTGNIPDGNVELDYTFTQGSTELWDHNCVIDYADGVASWQFEIPNDGPWDYLVETRDYGSVEASSFSGTCNAAPVAPPAPQAPDAPFSYADRLNAQDIAAPVAIYPVELSTGTGLHFYAIGADGTGSLVLVVTPEQIAAVPALPATNTLIAASADGSLTLYRLTTGEFQVNMGGYVAQFTNLVVDASVAHS